MTIRKKSRIFFLFLIAVILSLVLALFYLLHRLDTPGTLDRNLSIYGFFMLALTAQFFVFIFFFSRKRIISPLEQLEESARLYNTNSKIFTLPPIGDDEIGSLALSIAKMIETIEEQKEKMARDEKLSALGLLTAGMAHEINNPIGYMQSNFRSLEKYLTRIHEALPAHAMGHDADPIVQGHKPVNRMIDDALDMIKDNQEGLLRIHEIVNGIKGISRTDPDAVQEMIDLRGCAEEAVKTVEHEQPGKARIIWSEENVPPVYGTRGRVHQVLLNVIKNAYDALPPRDGMIRLELREDDSCVYLSIEDNGPGIDDEAKFKIFNPFYTTKAPGEGTGLGLNISYQIMKLLDGEILVEDSQWKGARFILKFPKGKETE